MYFFVKYVKIENKNRIGYKMGIPVEKVRPINDKATILANDFSILNFFP